MASQQQCWVSGLPVLTGVFTVARSPRTGGLPAPETEVLVWVLATFGSWRFENWWLTRASGVGLISVLTH